MNSYCRAQGGKGEWGRRLAGCDFHGGPQQTGESSARSSPDMNYHNRNGGGNPDRGRSCIGMERRGHEERGTGPMHMSGHKEDCGSPQQQPPIVIGGGGGGSESSTTRKLHPPHSGSELWVGPEHRRTSV